MTEQLSRRAIFRMTLALGAVCAISSSGCNKGSNEIPVGAYLSLSGPDTTFGVDTKEGIDLALAEANAAGGIKGRKIKVIYEDNKSISQEASNKVRQLIDRDKVVALLGEVASSRSLAGGLVANTKKIPMITPSSTAVEVTKDREYVFRTCFTDAQQGEVAARFAVQTLKKKNFAILFAAQDNYSSGLAKSFKESVQKLGGTVVVEKGYQVKDTQFKTLLTTIKQSNPDLLFIPVYYNDMVQISRQAAEVGIPGSMIFGGDGWDSQDLLDQSENKLDGAYFTNHYAPDVPWPNAQTFLKNYKERYKRVPTSLSAQGYDAARLLFDAMGRATELTPEAIKVAISQTKDFAGATGNLTIDKEHNANKPIVIVQIKGKSFVYVNQLMAE
jgi:branched-chain amino acid transport system substrate-binding protein